MPAPASASAEHIKDVNTRYHDAAASSYDSKWGIDFGELGRRQVEAKLGKALGPLLRPSFGDALEIGAGTGYFSLNLMQTGRIGRATATDISPGMLATLRDTAARPRPRGGDRGDRGGAPSLRGRELRPRLRARGPPPHPGPAPRLRGVLPRPAPRRRGRLLRRAVALRGPPRGPAQARRGGRFRRPGGRCSAPASASGRRPPTTTATISSPRSTSMPSRPATCAPIWRRQASRRAGCAARSCWRTPGDGACGPWSPPRSRIPFPPPGAGLPSAATWRCSGSTRRCSSRGFPRSSSTTCSAAPACPSEPPRRGDRCGGARRPGGGLRRRLFRARDEHGRDGASSALDAAACRRLAPAVRAAIAQAGGRRRVPLRRSAQPSPASAPASTWAPARR